MKQDRALREMVALIAEACDPEEIFLYGSHAKGQATVESDLDLLVVVGSGVRPAELAIEVRELLDGFPVRVDLKVMTREDLEARSRQPFGFIQSIRSSGIVLYRRAQANV